MKQCLLCLDFCKESFCGPCHGDLPWLKTFCPRCGRFEATSKLCALCQQAPCPWDWGFAPLPYESPISPLILKLKLYQQVACARTLTDLFLDAFPGGPLPGLILPAPLHPRRLLSRGFNQSTELARLLSQGLKIPYSPYYLKRLKHGPHQRGSNKIARLSNVKDAFELARPLKVHHIALVDDVLTTGQTLGAMCEAIRKVHPSIRIDVWAMAQVL